MNYLGALFLGFAVAVSSAANVSQAAEPSSGSIPNFLQVSPDVYRGGLPGADGIAYLGQIGVKTILDMETTESEISSEKDVANILGIRVFSEPLPPLLVRPTFSRMQEILEILQDPTNYPIFVHCRHGQDRTGVAIGLYRVYVQNWSADDAYREMVELGFHPSSEIGLRCYFQEKTGMETPSICAFVPSYDPD